MVSAEGQKGIWKRKKESNNPITGVGLEADSDNEDGDRLAAMDLRFINENGKVFDSNGFPGSTSPWAWAHCPDGTVITGFQTRVLPADANTTDHTALNRVKFICSSIPISANRKYMLITGGQEEKSVEVFDPNNQNMFCPQFPLGRGRRHNHAQAGRLVCGGESVIYVKPNTTEQKTNTSTESPEPTPEERIKEIQLLLLDEETSEEEKQILVKELEDILKAQQGQKLPNNSETSFGNSISNIDFSNVYELYMKNLLKVSDKCETLGGSKRITKYVSMKTSRIGHTMWDSPLGVVLMGGFDRDEETHEIIFKNITEIYKEETTAAAFTLKHPSV